MVDQQDCCPGLSRHASLDHQHAKVRWALSLPGGFVLHSLRHTFLTRLGEAGADAFEIMRLAGHSSVSTSQRYVHPTPESLERVMERLDAMNQKARGGQLQDGQITLAATISATVKNTPAVNH